MLTSHDITDRAIRRPAPAPAPLSYRERWTLDTAPDRLSAALRMYVDGATLESSSAHADISIATMQRVAIKGYASREDVSGLTGLREKIEGMIRPCMRCAAPIFSHHRGHRLCRVCSSSDDIDSCDAS